LEDFFIDGFAARGLARFFAVRLAFVFLTFARRLAAIEKTSGRALR
jgi:hypothetical protein